MYAKLGDTHVHEQESGGEALVGSGLVQFSSVPEMLSPACRQYVPFARVCLPVDVSYKSCGVFALLLEFDVGTLNYAG